MCALSFGVGQVRTSSGEAGNNADLAERRIRTNKLGDSMYEWKEEDRRLSRVRPRRVERDVKGLVKKRRLLSVQGWSVGRCR